MDFWFPNLIIIFLLGCWVTLVLMKIIIDIAEYYVNKEQEPHGRLGEFNHPPTGFLQ